MLLLAGGGVARASFVSLCAPTGFTKPQEPKQPPATPAGFFSLDASFGLLANRRSCAECVALCSACVV